jgi:hypothetical protein
MITSNPGIRNNTPDIKLRFHLASETMSQHIGYRLRDYSARSLSSLVNLIES